IVLPQEEKRDQPEEVHGLNGNQASSHTDEPPSQAGGVGENRGPQQNDDVDPVAAVANFHGEASGRIRENGRLAETSPAGQMNEPRGHTCQIAGKTVDKGAQGPSQKDCELSQRRNGEDQNKDQWFAR